MIVAIVQARLGSTRLPEKIFLKLGSKTVLEHILERIKKGRFIQNIIVATTIQKKDLEIVKFCAERNVSIYCGSENDVLDRFYQAARLFRVKHIVRVTSDCPLIDPKVIDDVIRIYLKKKADYASNTLEDSYPDGEDVEVFSFAALKKAWQKANLLSEREHVTPYIKKHPKLFKLVSLKYKENIYDKRWTLDAPEDYRLIKLIYRRLYKKNAVFGMKQILEFIKKNPGIEKMNRHILRNEGYLKSLKKDRVIKNDR